MVATSITTSDFLLNGDDLLNKFGFADGDLLEDTVRDWAKSAWPADALDPSDDDDDPLWRYVDHRRVLVSIIETELVPELPRPLRDQFIVVGGVHNPTRVWPPEGVDEDAWEERALTHLLEVQIRVSTSTVYSRCVSLFPTRSRAWILLADALTGQLSLEIALGTRSVLETKATAQRLATEAHERLGEERTRLLTEMLASWDLRDGRRSLFTQDDLDQLIAVAELC